MGPTSYIAKIGSNQAVQTLFERKAKASEAIKPGMLVEIVTTDTEFQKHGTAGGNAQALFATELNHPELANDGSLAGTAAFPDGDTISAAQGPGLKVAWLATSQTIVAGDPLESAGNGYLRKHTPGDESTTILHSRIVARAAQPKTTTGTVLPILVITQ